MMAKTLSSNGFCALNPILPQVFATCHAKDIAPSPSRMDSIRHA